MITPPALDLRDCPEDVKLEATSRCRGVYPLGQADKRDAERLHVIEQRNQVLQVAA